MPTPTVLGHWDVYELLHRVKTREDRPLELAILPGLRKGSVRAIFFAVGGDSRSHASGSDRPMSGTLMSMDVALREIDGTAETLVVRTRQDLERLADNEVGFILVLEGGRPLEGNIAVLRQFFRLGVRCLLLTWNGRNELGDGVGEGADAGGLSSFGKDVVREMRRLGMILDLSHLAERGFWQAIDVYNGPVMATHSNAKALHDHRRNITDEQIRAVAETGGVVGVAFMPAFLGPGTPSVETVVDHLEHMCGLVGAEHVAIGPDFSYGPVAEEHRRHRRYEGVQVDLRVPYPIPDAASLPLLEDAMRRRGFPEDDLRMILGHNLLRVAATILPSASAPT